MGDWFLILYWTGPIGIGLFLAGLGILVCGIGKMDLADIAAKRAKEKK